MEENKYLDTMIWESSAKQAREITWSGSKQTYFVARILVDKDLVDDFYRAYAYFRWADNIVDGSSLSNEERISFIKRQKRLIDSFYSKNFPDDLVPEEKILADLIARDKSENSGLHSFIYKMFAVISFDALRKGKLVSQEELLNYIDTLGTSVTDGLQYFIGNAHPYPNTENRYLAAKAAHITHLLRDLSEDIADGFFNIPNEYVLENEFGLDDLNSPWVRSWVRDQVEQARNYFSEGKRYLDSLEVFRCKLAGYWYCVRFEIILDAIERDGYNIQTTYNERQKIFFRIRLFGVAVKILFQHIFRRTV